MSELCLSSTAQSDKFSSENGKSCIPNQFSILLLSDLIFVLFSFFLSHPLYFSYFIFFSPYLLKLTSFLCPLFFTTSLLLLLALPHFSDSKLGFVLSAIRTQLHSISSLPDEVGDFHPLEELQALTIAFSLFDVTQETVSEVSSLESEENSTIDREFEAIGAMEEQSSEEGYWFLKEFDEFGNVTCIPDEKKIEPPPPLGANSDKVDPPISVRIGSEAVGGNDDASNDDDDGNGKVSSEECVTKLMTTNSRGSGGDHSQRSMEGSWPSDGSLGSYGSMRKDKEWKRTLAGKLFEERKNGEDEEGMDMLWETYESESGKKSSKKTGKKGKNTKNEIGYIGEEEEEEDEMVGPMCCLQALKMSTGKMNLGMGRSNLGKLSKAIKGFGWVHHVTRRASKKGGAGVYK